MQKIKSLKRVRSLMAILMVLTLGIVFTGTQANAAVAQDVTAESSAVARAKEIYSTSGALKDYNVSTPATFWVDGIFTVNAKVHVLSSSQISGNAPVQVYIDGGYVGMSVGDGTNQTFDKKLSPGAHSISIHNCGVWSAYSVTIVG